ncbi:hypothetical protein ABZ467_32245 [Streptomyces sp. NPDC005727]|uniref:hypothetical protein n=1 Tax=Streptomyces sp. NPDC005727 TaxID=3157053 RepID=UPI00340DD227
MSVERLAKADEALDYGLVPVDPAGPHLPHRALKPGYVRDMSASWTPQVRFHWVGT